jgi:hypothetical protein
MNLLRIFAALVPAENQNNAGVFEISVQDFFNV